MAGNRGPAITVDGIVPFRAGLKSAGSSFPKMLAKANKRAVSIIVPVARSNVSGLNSTNLAGHGIGKMQALVAPTIKAAQSQVAAQIKAGSGVAFGMGALLGAKKWRQFAPWVGNDWTLSGPDDGPYGIAPAVDSTAPEFVEAYGKEMDELTRLAFPS